jgi:hypothetical protein
MLAAVGFFGASEQARPIRIRLASPQTVFDCQVSRIYADAASGLRQSRSCRINRLPVIGFLGHCFVFLEETDEPDLYDLWCSYDVALIAASFDGWDQGVGGRGARGNRARLFAIVNAPVPRGEISRLISPRHC